MKEKVNDLLSDSKKVTKSLRKKNEKLGKQLAELATTLDNIDCDVSFDELGISRLYIDEAHNYKNVPIETKADNVLGITRSGSKKCNALNFFFFFKYIIASGMSASNHAAGAA